MQHIDDPIEATVAARPAAAHPAHLGWRLLAIAYDLLPLLALWFATSTLVYLARGNVPVVPGSAAAWAELALLWSVAGAYFVVSWRRGGQTIGMRPWRLEVLGADGRVASLRALCLRYVAATASLLLAGLGFAWSLVDAERRCLHDIASSTRFVRLERA